MNKKKLILMLLLVIFVTGCGSISYDLDIRRNKIYESLNMQLDVSYQATELNSIVAENINSYPTSKTENVNYEINGNNVIVFNNFDSVYELSENELISRLYNNVEVNIQNNITSVTFKDYNNSSFECGEFDEGCLLVLDKVNVNLTSEYEITDSNADFIDTKNNKYTWVLDSESDNIYFSYSDKVLWNMVIKNYFNEHLDMVILVIIGAAVLIAGAIILGKFLRTVKMNNS